MSNDSLQETLKTRPPASARRRAPQHSVSLRQVPPKQAARRNAAASKGESAASSLVNNRDSSGESSNVDNWFERSNNHLDSETHSRLANNEPPFFLQNNSSSGSGPTTTNPLLPAPYPSKLLHSTGSSSEEYRSVIDDLTIQNKRLKERLRRYEQMNSPHLQSEQLFELRVHGLPADRKRQLEDLLRGFTQSMTAPPKSTKQSHASKSASVAAKPTSSLTSTRFAAADSGYGSMMTPNQTSASKPAMATASSNAASGSNSGLLSMTASDMKAKDRSMQSYLRDTSSSLLPTSAAGLSERAKKKLVVLRLEQIFGGRGALPEATGQPAQQQELSDMAARDDRTAFGALAASNDDEGAREAPIMLSHAGNNSPGEDVQHEPLAHDAHDPKAPAHAPSSSLEQRPTRPLDLDPARAQVPSDNIEYFRHLGFNVAKADAKDAIVADSHGWIYANLLFNMAQLHTLNVTTDFAKRAVAEYSDKFELSADGRKVRWRVHPRLVQTSSMSSDEHDASDPPSRDVAPIFRRKLSATATATTTPSLANPQASRTRLVRAARGLTRERSFVYTPMFHRQSETDEDASMADYESYDSWADAAAGPDASAAAGSGLRGLKRRGPGPIIYYNNAFFCTDLSGDGSSSADAAAANTSHPPPQQPSVSRPDSLPAALGLYPTKPRSSSPESDGPPQALVARYFEYDAEPPAKRRALAATHDDDKDEDDNDGLPIHFPVGHDPSSKHVSFAESYKALDFEASGLGGATPADNLAITVVKETRPRLSTHKGSTLRPPPTRVDRLLGPRPSNAPVHDRILSVRTSTLKPSSLPDPSVAFGPNDSDDDDDEDEQSPDPAAVAAAAVADDHDMDFGQLPSLVLLDPHPIDSHYSPDDSSQSQASSLAAESGSQAELFDLLATARQIDPHTVLAREREYEAEMAERLADDIPAGSSAATAGGGSNNGSPLEGVLKRSHMALSRDGNRAGDARKAESSSSSSSDDDDNDDDDDDDNDSTGVERSISS